MDANGSITKQASESSAQDGLTALRPRSSRVAYRAGDIGRALPPLQLKR
jgi:hypothetical protein